MIEESLEKGKLMRGKTKEEREQEENMFAQAQAKKDK